MNVVYTARQMKRRYEVWFLRCGLADGRGAWWLRYLLLNLGRGGAARSHRPNLCKFGLPGSRAKASRRHSSKAIPPRALQLSSRRQLPFHLRIAESAIEEGTCWGEPQGGRARDFVEAAYHSQFGVVLSDKDGSVFRNRRTPTLCFPARFI
jgi:hypothetical protein